MLRATKLERVEEREREREQEMRMWREMWRQVIGKEIEQSQQKVFRECEIITRKKQVLNDHILCLCV